MVLIYLAQGRIRWRAVVNTVINFRIPQKVRNFLTSWTTTSFSSRILFRGVLSFNSVRNVATDSLLIYFLRCLFRGMSGNNINLTCVSESEPVFQFMNPNKLSNYKSRGSSVSRETRLPVGRPVLGSRQGQWWDIFFFATVFRPALGPHPASYLMGIRGSLAGVKRPGRETDH